MKRRKLMTWILLTLGAVIAGRLAIAITAPHTPKLIIEGYPAVVWPARGSFADVIGVQENTTGASAVVAKTLPANLGDEIGTSALLVYQRGQIMVEHYSAKFTAQTRFNSFSMVKSLVGALVLKAHAEGKIKSLDDPLGAYLPSAAPELLATPLQAFLDMKSGLVMEPDATEGMKPLKVSAGKIYSRRFMGDDLSDAEVRQGAYTDHARHDVLDRPGEALQGRFVYFLGSGGQMTYVMPEKGLVVVRFAERITPLHSLLYNLSRAGMIAN